jgi:putative ABC transport system permease protein
MPVADRTGRRYLRPYFWLITLIGVIVPRRLRADWRGEWEAELRHREAMLAEWDRLNWLNRLDLFWRSLGAFWDAVWLQSYRWEDEMIQDLRFGLRQLRMQPIFTLVAVLTLALGTGATTLIFSVVNGVLLRPLPFPSSERIIRIQEKHDQSANASNLTYASFLDLGQQTDTLERIAAARFWTTNLTDGGEPERVNSLLVTSGYFSVLGLAPMLGRAFLPEEDAPGRDNVVILSHALWQRRFGADPDLIGKSIKAGGNSVTVVGVMPPGFRSGYPFQGEYDLWSPLAASGSLSTNRRSHLLGVTARLRPGITIEQAQAELSSIARRIEEQNPGIDDPGLGISAARLHDQMVAPLRPALLVFLCAVGLLLMIACANVANLMLARGARRAREMAIRTALGAGHRRLARQLLTESTLLAFMGGGAGLLLAVWGVRVVASLNPSAFPRINEVSIDGQVLGFALLVSLLTGVMFGLAPVLQLPKRSLGETLKEGGRDATGAKRTWLRQTLVVTEVALALVLLVGAGLLINGFIRLMQVNRGFDPANVLTINLNLPFSKYPNGAKQSSVLQQVLEQVSAVPGVRSAGLISTLPFAGGPATGFEIEGRPPVEPGEEPMADIRIADANYFRALAIPLRAGRTFTTGDTGDAPRVMIINEEMARRHWPGENPVGQLVTMKDWGPPLTGEIVGVVGDTKSDGLDTATRPMIYWPYHQFPGIFNNLVIRTEGDPLSVVAAVKSRIWAVDGEQPLSRIQTMDEVIAGSVAPRRFSMLLMAIFASLGLALAVIGIYGVISYTTTQRTREIGVRLALGAGRADVLRLIIRQGMKLTLTGVAAGLMAAFALTRLMAHLLFGVSATDPATFAGVSLILTAVAIVACYVPARKASKMDPVVALRHE